MDGILIPIIIVGSLSLICGIGLGIASKRFQVFLNPKIALLTNVLPGINCGACGYSECKTFAKAVADKTMSPTGCYPGGPKVAHAIADILDITIETIEPLMAVVHCKGGVKEAGDRAVYSGISDCHAATIIGNGAKICQDGCLGLGTCVKTCPFGAISINSNGVAVVEADKCTGCGSCVQACPRHIISLIPGVYKIYLACSNHDRGAKVKKYCDVGCTACTMCVKATPSGAITMENNLPVLDYTKSENFIPAANKCPSHCFIDLVTNRPKANIDTKCDGCGECIAACPIPGTITGEKGLRHIIDKEKCIGCGLCLDKCHVHAISVWGAGFSQKAKSSPMRK